jgi:signal peptidase I
MTLTPDESARSPWITVWFSPRLTIERLVATRPAYFVWVLVILGAAASIYNQAAATGGAGYLQDLRLVPYFVLASAGLGIVWLYVGAWLLSWIGRRLGGEASAQQVRTVYAWSMLPVILCCLIVLATGLAAENSALRSGVIALLVLVFSIWSLVIFLLMLGRVQHFGFWRAVLTYLFNLVVALAVAVFIRSFLYQPFNIPSGGMRPTLLVGDYIFVSKFSYGYSRFSLPFSPPLISDRIFASKPTRGDVVVFRFAKQNIDYVKRLVGLPGDRIQMKQGVLYINDIAVKREPAPPNDADGDACGSARTDKIKRWREALPNGVSYETIDCLDNGPLDDTGIYTVPPGEFFMLGDNLDNSSDSRMTSIGYVPFEDLIGRVSVIFFSRDTGAAGTAPRARAERVGMMVR